MKTTNMSADREG